MMAPTTLPEQVEFANWVKYQSDRTQAFARVWHNILYDVRTLPTRGRDAALGVLVVGMLLAARGRGVVLSRAWRGAVEDPRRCSKLIKWWIGNGLLISVDCVVSKVVSKKELPPTNDAVASAEKADSTANGKRPPRKGRTVVQPAAWVARFADEFARARGGTAPYGRIGKSLKPLVAKLGEGETWNRWVRWLASPKAKFGAEWFAENAGDFAAQPDIPTASTSDGERADRIRRAIAQYGAGPQFMTAEQYGAAFDNDDLAFIKRKGGIAAIWNSPDTSGARPR